MSTLLGFILQRLGITMFPDVLKRRSDGEDVAQARVGADYDYNHN